MTSYRTCKVVSYNITYGKNNEFWLIDNSYMGRLNKKNRTLLPMIVEQFSFDDFAFNRHSNERARLFKRCNNWTETTG